MLHQNMPVKQLIQEINKRIGFQKANNHNMLILDSNEYPVVANYWDYLIRYFSKEHRVKANDREMAIHW